MARNSVIFCTVVCTLVWTFGSCSSHWIEFDRAGETGDLASTAISEVAVPDQVQRHSKIRSSETNDKMSVSMVVDDIDPLVMEFASAANDKIAHSMVVNDMHPSGDINDKMPNSMVIEGMRPSGETNDNISYSMAVEDIHPSSEANDKMPNSEVVGVNNGYMFPSVLRSTSEKDGKMSDSMIRTDTNENILHPESVLEKSTKLRPDRGQSLLFNLARENHYRNIKTVEEQAKRTSQSQERAVLKPNTKQSMDTQAYHLHGKNLPDNARIRAGSLLREIITTSEKDMSKGDNSHVPGDHDSNPNMISGAISKITQLIYHIINASNGLEMSARTRIRRSMNNATIYNDTQPSHTESDAALENDLTSNEKQPSTAWTTIFQEISGDGVSVEPETSVSDFEEVATANDQYLSTENGTTAITDNDPYDTISSNGNVSTADLSVVPTGYLMSTSESGQANVLDSDSESDSQGIKDSSASYEHVTFSKSVIPLQETTELTPSTNTFDFGKDVLEDAVTNKTFLETSSLPTSSASSIWSSTSSGHFHISVPEQTTTTSLGSGKSVENTDISPTPKVGEPPESTIDSVSGPTKKWFEFETVSADDSVLKETSSHPESTAESSTADSNSELQPESESRSTSTDSTSESDIQPGVESDKHLETKSPISRSDNSLCPIPCMGPEWDIAKRTWQDAWEIHIYVFGVLFGLLAVYTILSTVRLWRVQRLLSTGYFVSLNTLIMVACGSRCFYLLYDNGYNSNQSFPISLDYFFYNITFPCLTSAFSILLYALVKATHVQLVSPSVQKIQVIIAVIVVHFVISVITDVMTHFDIAFMPVILFVSNMYFITWGLFLFFVYAYNFRQLYSYALKRQKNVTYTSPNRTYSVHEKVTSKFTLSTAVKITFFTAIWGLVCVSIQIYGIAGVQNTFTRERPKTWPWWLFHTVLRLIEFLICLHISYVVSLPFKYVKSDRQCSCVTLCLPCSEMLCCGQSDNSSNSIAGWSDLDVRGHDLSFRSVVNGDRFNGPITLFPDDPMPVVDMQQRSRPNSLLIIEDGYVRFQTDYDINKIVDSQNDLSHRPDDVHKMSTFPLRDGLVNTGYFFNADDARVKKKLEVFNDADFQVKSRKSSLASSEFFRVPSSVSLADSMANELDKAFESIRKDDQDRDNLDFDTVSDNANLNDTSLVSADSLLESESGKSSTSPSQRHLEPTGQPLSSTPKKMSPDRLSFSLPRRAKSSNTNIDPKEDDSKDELDIQQQLYRCSSDCSTRSPSRDSVKYSYLVDLDANENDFGFPSPGGRRPSDGQGSQAAVLTSLLKSGSSDNIDV